MARRVLTNLNLSYNEVLGLRVENRTSAPPNPQDGTIYFNTTVNAYRLFQNGEWFELTPFGGSDASPVVTVEHGSDPTVIRPIADMVIWRGTVEPNNWTDDDIWHDKS